MPRVVVDATQLDQRREHGGLPGVRDGNKRIAFLTAVIFLGLNGKDLEASEVDVVQVMVALAKGSMKESQLVEWLRPRLIRLAL